MKNKSKLKKKSELKKKQKKQSSPCGGSNPEKMVSDAIALNNEPLKHRLSGEQIYNI